MSSTKTVTPRRRFLPPPAQSDGRLPATLRIVHGETDCDLAAVNGVVCAAISSWNLPARVRRLALASLRYNETDQQYMNIALVEDDTGGAIGVAVWEDTALPDAVATEYCVLLHGLYVRPQWQNRGVGTGLLDFIHAWAKEHRCDAVVARVWRESGAFFCGQGFVDSTADGAAGTYPLQLRKSVR